MIEYRDQLLYPTGHFKEKGLGDKDTRARMAPPDTTKPLPIPHYADTAAMIEAMHEVGFVVIPNVLSPEEVQRLRAYADELGGADDSRYDVPNWCYNRANSIPFHQHPEMLDLIDRDPIGDIARGVMGEDCRLRYANTWTTGPGREMNVHMDWQPVALPPEVAQHPEFRLPVFWMQTIFYLTDMTLENGPTVVVPGSHKAGRPPCYENSYNGVQPQAACVPAGSAVLFRSEMWHGGLYHRADERRYMILMGYNHSMLKTNLPRWQDEEMWNPEVRRRATTAQRRLLGEPAPKQQDDYGNNSASSEQKKKDIA